MSKELCIPNRLVQQVLQTLIAAHLVIEIASAEAAYTPGRPLEQINAHHILQAMRARGQELLTRNEPVREEVYGEFARIEEAEERAATSITMLALVHRADARLQLASAPPSEKENAVSPALMPPETKPASTTPEQAEIPDAPEPRTESSAAAQSPPPVFQPKEPILPAKLIVEPQPDEERDFPL
jgi:DNA-binding IscR family transcriptional regulator